MAWRVLGQWCSLPGELETSGEAMKRETLEKPSGIPLVWVVDDSPLQCEICRTALEPLFSVRVFQGGAMVLEALGSEVAPDLVVLDWRMPDLSGADVCRFVRQTRDAAQLPVLVLTATGSDEDLVEAFAAGANDFVVKPFSSAALNARVAALVRYKQLHSRLSEVELRLRVEAEFRERFIGMLAHDLRQPLNTFVLANQTIAKNPGGSLPLLEMQRRAADRMSRMVSELLDFTRSRPETGMPVERQLVDFESVARTVLEEMRVGHPNRAFTLTVHGDCSGYWDRDRLAQVCSNLIGNAVDHSATGASPVEIQLERLGGNVVFTVANQGKPIPSDLLPTLFDAFRRGHAPPRVSGGVGLGLHIVSEIARAHGGSVTAKSDPISTVFEVALPTGLRDSAVYDCAPSKEGASSASS
jgi:phosphoserine phosphatase RsbU/P